MRLNLPATSALMLLALILTGCGGKAMLITRLDPAYSPSKDDPIFVTVSRSSSIQDRQLLPVIIQEMKETGFNIADFDRARWVAVIGNNSREVITGVTTVTSLFSAPSNFATGTSLSTSSVRTEQIGDVLISLFTKESELKGDPLEIWEGRITTASDRLEEKPKTVVRALLEQFGKNHEESLHFGIRNHEGDYK